jgi:hypothetical protein
MHFEREYEDLYMRWKIAKLFYRDQSPAPVMGTDTAGMPLLQARIRQRVDKEIARSYPDLYEQN